MKYSVVIPCAGIGSRTGLNYNKVRYQIKDKMVIEHTLTHFLNDTACTQIVLVISASDLMYMRHLEIGKVMLAIGSKTRQSSVYCGLKKVINDYVLIHDGARPFVKQKTIEAILEKLKIGACIPVLPVTDTIKVVEDGEVRETLKREVLVHVQTPQAFRTATILEAHKKAEAERFEGSDDASLVERYHLTTIYTVVGDEANIKITTKHDLNTLE